MKLLRTIRKYIEYGLVMVGVVFIHLVLIPLLLIPVILYAWFVVRPILNAVQTEPLYWLSWVDVKRKSGCGRSNVLSVLHVYARPGGLFDCQLRSEKELVRLERVLDRRRPRYKQPMTPDDTIFYRFRRRGGGSGESSWKPVFNLFPARLPVRA